MLLKRLELPCEFPNGRGSKAFFERSRRLHYGFS